MQILDLCVIIFTVSFIENAVFAGGFAVDGMDRLPTEKKSFLFFSALLLLNTTLSGAAVWFFDRYLFSGVSFVRIILSPILSVGLMFLMLYIVSKYLPLVYRAVKPSRGLLLLNTATVGIVYIFTSKSYNIKDTLLYIVLSVLGVLLSYAVFADINERIIEKYMPRAFRGLPGLLIALGLIMMVFSGISGISLSAVL